MAGNAGKHKKKTKLIHHPPCRDNHRGHTHRCLSPLLLRKPTCIFLAPVWQVPSLENSQRKSPKASPGHVATLIPPEEVEKGGNLSCI